MPVLVPVLVLAQVHVPKRVQVPVLVQVQVQGARAVRRFRAKVCRGMPRASGQVNHGLVERPYFGCGPRDEVRDKVRDKVRDEVNDVCSGLGRAVDFPQDVARAHQVGCTQRGPRERVRWTLAQPLENGGALVHLPARRPHRVAQRRQRNRTVVHISETLQSGPCRRLELLDLDPPFEGPCAALRRGLVRLFKEPCAAL